jgi:hypothetical protein
MSDGAFGNLFSIAILFLLFQIAQAKLAKMKRVNLMGRAYCPVTMFQISSSRTLGNFAV